MTEVYYEKNFWNHPVIQECLNTEGIFVETINIIIRRHPGGLWCIGIDEDTKHFHSSNLEKAIFKTLVYQRTGENWYKNEQEWRK